MDGASVGYIPTDSWLYRAIVLEGNGCLDKVLLKGARPAGLRLKVQLGGDACRSVQFGERLPQSQPSAERFGALVATILFPF